MAQTYWWIVDYVTKDNGKIQPVIIGNRAFDSEISAQRALDRMTTTQHVELMELPTRNTAKASQYIRGKVLERSRNTKDALTKVGHPKPVNVIEEEVSKPRFKRTGTGLLERQRSRHRVSRGDRFQATR